MSTTTNHFVLTRPVDTSLKTTDSINRNSPLTSSQSSQRAASSSRARFSQRQVLRAQRKSRKQKRIRDEFDQLRAMVSVHDSTVSTDEIDILDKAVKLVNDLTGKVRAMNELNRELEARNGSQPYLCPQFRMQYNFAVRQMEAAEAKFDEVRI